MIALRRLRHELSLVFERFTVRQAVELVFVGDEPDPLTTSAIVARPSAPSSSMARRVFAEVN